MANTKVEKIKTAITIFLLYGGGATAARSVDDDGGGRDSDGMG